MKNLYPFLIGIALGSLVVFFSPFVKVKGVEPKNLHDVRVDSLVVIIDSLNLVLVKDSLMLNAYETQNKSRLDSVRSMSSAELYRVWSGGRHLRLDTIESVR